MLFRRRLRQERSRLKRNRTLGRSADDWETEAHLGADNHPDFEVEQESEVKPRLRSKGIYLLLSAPRSQCAGELATVTVTLSCSTDRAVRL